MYRAIPVGNKILSKKWIEKDLSTHKDKLRNARSAIDHKRPTNFKYQPKNVKKEQMLEGISLVKFQTDTQKLNAKTAFFSRK